MLIKRHGFTLIEILVVIVIIAILASLVAPSSFQNGVMFVGEIRDSETAEIATQAALTGHLALSTLHTNDAPSALGMRLVTEGATTLDEVLRVTMA